MSISRELWQQIDPLLSKALDMDEDAREPWLRDLDATQPQLSPLLRKMLATHERAERAQELETVPKIAPAPPASSAFSIGTRIGSFELIRPLGRGGMGEVWLARQADGRVEREVALKLPTVYEHSEVWRERFRRERDILAKLAHPNIAQLYDAGVSEQSGSRGQPYLAMEYVEGVSLTEYVSARRSTIDERLRLFLQILAAVADAHRHLVVHRDLKPANILIDNSGRVKLLDFGIAKLLDDGGVVDTADLTRLGGRVMTLRYAAPEQVADGEISTATDVYALGVILHELLTGLSPYRAVRDGKPFTDAALLSAEPSVPSSIAMSGSAAADRGLSSAKQLSHQISGDLDAIVLKAMRRNPADRYTSVDQFDDDIGRYFGNRPVKARNGTWRYLAGRFAMRNKLPLATAAAVIVTMAVGLVMVERERRVAIAEKARAEKHFASVRKLANSFIFDINDKIENIPGATKARLALMENATKYLDQLSTESATDPHLQIEVANAYGRLGDILGGVAGQNIGSHQSALLQYDHAIALLAPYGKVDQVAANALDKTKAAAVRELLSILERKSQLLYELSRTTESAEAVRQAYGLAVAQADLPTAEMDDKVAKAHFHVEHTRRLAGAKRDPQIRMKGLINAKTMVDDVLKNEPQNQKALNEAASIENAIGVALRRDPRPESKLAAIASLQRAIAIWETDARRSPNDAIKLRTALTPRSALGLAYLDLGENENAYNQFRILYEGTRQFAERDPGNFEFQRSLISAEESFARANISTGKYLEALNLVDDGLQRFSRLPAEDTTLLLSRLFNARLHALEGEALLAIARGMKSGPERRGRLDRAKVAFSTARNAYEIIDALPQRPFSVTNEIKTMGAQISATEGELRRPAS